MIAIVKGLLLLALAFVPDSATAQMARNVTHSVVSGADLYVYRTKTENYVLLKGFVDTGVDDPSFKPALGGLMADMLSRGTLAHDKPWIDSSLDDIGASISFYGSNERLYFTLSCLKDDLPAALALLLEQLRSPAFSAAQLSLAKQHDRETWKMFMSQPSVQADFAFGGALFPVGHRRHPPTAEQLLVSIDTITIEDLKSFHAQHISPQGLTIVAVGDVDTDRLKTALDKGMAGWVGNHPQPMQVAEPVPREAHEIEVAIPDKTSTSVKLGQITALKYSDLDSPALRLGIAILGRGTTSRLKASIRDKEGLAYSISAGTYGDSVDPERRTRMIIEATFAPDVVDKGVASIRRELLKWWKDGVTEEEVRNQITNMVGYYKVRTTEPDELSSFLLDTLQRGLTPQWLDGYPKALELVTAEQVNTAIRTYIDPDKMILVKAGTLQVTPQAGEESVPFPKKAPPLKQASPPKQATSPETADVSDLIEAIRYAKSEVSLSPDARLLAYSLKNPQLAMDDSNGVVELSDTGMFTSDRGEEILIHDLEVDTSRVLTPGWGSSIGAQWSPDGQQLAFISDKSGRAELWVWDRGTDTFHSFPQREAGLVYLNRSFIHWSPDSRRIYYFAFPEGATQHHPVVDKSVPELGVSEVDSLPAGMDKQAAPKAVELDVASARLAILKEVVEADLDARTVRRVSSGAFKDPRNLLISPDGEKIAVAYDLHKTEGKSDERGYNLSLVRIHGTGRELEVKDLPIPTNQLFENFAWSPDSEKMAVLTDGGTGDIILADLKNGKVRNLTAQLDVPKTKKSYRRNRQGDGLAPKFAHAFAPVWSRDGSTLYAIGEGDLWSIPVANPHHAKNLTGAEPFSTSMIFSFSDPRTYNIPDAGGGFSMAPLGQPSAEVYLRMQDAQGEAYMALEDTTQKLRMLVARTASGEFSSGPDAKPSEGGWLLLQSSTVDSPVKQDLLKLGAGEHRPLQLTHALGQLKGAKRKLLEWTVAGQPAYGTLLLPSQMQAATKLPLIVVLYPGSLRGKRLMAGGWLGGDLTNGPEVLARNGYAVLYMPDIPLRVGTPMKDIQTNAGLAVQAAIASGEVDPQRIGMLGQSYGGYAVNSLEVQSPTPFRCGVSVNGIADIVASSLSSIIGESWVLAQGRMKEPMWMDMVPYIENSPVTYAHLAQAPLLIVSGTADMVVPRAESRMMFEALRRNKVPARLVTYEGMAHTPVTWNAEMLQDYWNRILDWFDGCLKT